MLFFDFKNLADSPANRTRLLAANAVEALITALGQHPNTELVVIESCQGQ